MKNPGFTHKVISLLSVGSLAVAVTAAAESPETGTNKNRVSRPRPQVIYHLPPASNYAATLHSQAKNQNNELPVDSSMPTSLQTSHINANAAAAQTEAQSQTPIPPPRERTVKPRMRSNRPQIRAHSFSKSSGPGNSHGNRSHKK
jgi:hypothetical protein